MGTGFSQERINDHLVLIANSNRFLSLNEILDCCRQWPVACGVT
jgi:hypothetical protein